MRLISLLLSIIGSALILSAQTDSIKSGNGGILALKEATIDLGSISGDSIVSARFTLYNKGTEPVRILRIFSDCNCTIPSYARDAIEPGDSAQFDVSYNPKGYRYGQFRRTLRIRSTASNPYLSAALKGTIARKHKK